MVFLRRFTCDLWLFTFHRTLNFSSIDQMVREKFIFRVCLIDKILGFQEIKAKNINVFVRTEGDFVVYYPGSISLILSCDSHSNLFVLFYFMSILGYNYLYTCLTSPTRLQVKIDIKYDFI